MLQRGVVRINNKTAGSPSVSETFKHIFYSFRMASPVHGTRSFSCSVTTVFTSEASLMLTFNKPNHLQVSTDNNGLFLVSKIEN